MSNTTGMCGGCSQWMAHNGFATAQVECPSQICTAQSPGCSMWSPSQVGPAFHAVPRTMSLRFSGALQGYRPRWAVHFVPCPGLSSSGDRVLCEHTVQCGPCILFTCLVQLLTFPGALRENSPECVMCLLWGADLRLWHSWLMSNTPGPRENVVSNWEPVHNLVDDAVFGVNIAAAPCLPALGVTLLPLCVWEVPICQAAGLLAFGISSILCSLIVPGIRAFSGKSLLLFPLSDNPTVWIAISR